MQSFLQYRNLGRRLRDEYKSNKVSALSSRVDSGFSSVVDCQHYADKDIEKVLNPDDPGRLFPSPNQPTEKWSKKDISPRGALAHLDSSIAICTDGVEVRHDKTKGTGEKNFVVVSDMSNDMNPRQWANSIRIWATFLIFLHGSFVGIASSIDSAALNHVRKHFDRGEVTGSMTIGLFLVGFGFGALFAGPLSERIGRNTVFIGSWTSYMICIMASSLSPSIGFQLTFRFLAGFFGSAPLTCGGASIGDLWSPVERIYTFPVFANAAILGPMIGPVFGGYIGANTRHSWRWTEWMDTGCAGLVLVLILLTQRETFAPVLLKWKARHLRKISKNDRYQTEASLNEQPILDRLRTIICRPFQITMREPVLMVWTLWLTFIWIIMFTFLSGYKIMFRRIHGTSEGRTGLCFIGIVVGLLLSSATVPLITLRLRRDLHKACQQGLDGLAPESRLWYGLISAPAVPIALFWMAWTDNASVSIWSPLGASVLLGYGMLGMFTSGYEYIIHTYGSLSPPALNFNTFTRYIIAGIMVEVAPHMWRNLGVSWTLTMLGCISAILTPVPYVLYVWGPKIRARSHYAAVKT